MEIIRETKWQVGVPAWAADRQPAPGRFMGTPCSPGGQRLAPAVWVQMQIPLPECCLGFFIIFHEKKIQLWLPIMLPSCLCPFLLALLQLPQLGQHPRAAQHGGDAPLVPSPSLTEPPARLYLLLQWE